MGAGCRLFVEAIGMSLKVSKPQDFSLVLPDNVECGLKVLSCEPSTLRTYLGGKRRATPGK
jgi:hypothetical protein